MNSKEALEKIKEFNINITYNSNLNEFIDPFVDFYGEEVSVIEKDLDKLDQLEKIEKELGMDLITMFKALKNGIYIKNWCGEIEYYKCRGIALQGMIVIDNICNYADCDFDVDFKDYGKTWSVDKKDLTSEELADDK